MRLKLVPMGDKLEVRYQGPNITPGYWQAPELTADAFDEEGFFKSGDAVTWIDPNNIHLGLKFDGRIAEDFKLATGTFVSVGPLRAKIIAAGAPYVQDAVITGLNMKEVGALLFTTPKVRDLAGLPAHTSLPEVLAHPKVLAHFQSVLNHLAASATGSANRVARLLLLAQPPSIDKGEVTDKGSINQRAVLKHRDGLVQDFHHDSLDQLLKPSN
jgi:feruloyl-CoA synthase